MVAFDGSSSSRIETKCHLKSLLHIRDAQEANNFHLLNLADPQPERVGSGQQASAHEIPRHRFIRVGGMMDSDEPAFPEIATPPGFLADY